MNWTLQLFSHNLILLYCLTSLGKLTSISLLNMHLRSSVFSPEPAGISHLLTFWPYTILKSVLIYSTAPTSGVVLQNPLSVFLTKSSPKPFVSSTILASPNLSNLYPIVVYLEIFPSFMDTFTGIALGRSGRLFQFLWGVSEPPEAQLIHTLSKFHCLIHELYPTNHHSSLEHATYGTSCLPLAFL